MYIKVKGSYPAGPHGASYLRSAVVLSKEFMLWSTTAGKLWQEMKVGINHSLWYFVTTLEATCRHDRSIFYWDVQNLINPSNYPSI